MQTIGLRLNVPVGFGVDGLIAKINGYVGYWVTTRQSKALQKAKLDAVMLIPGTFSDCKISDKWKKEKAEYLEEKYSW